MTESEAFSLPRYHKCSDAEIGEWSNEEFADKLLERSYLLGEKLLHRDGYEIIEMDEETKRKGLADYCLRLAWLEYWNGTNPPAKQMIGLEKDQANIDILLRLSQQIIDEVKHQRVWSKWVQTYGGNPRIQDYKVDPDVLQMYRATFDFNEPEEIAASLQCTGEAILSFHLGGKMDPKDSISYRCFPEDLRMDIAKSVIAEEPRHIAVGREIIIRFGGGVEKRRKLMQIQIDKMKAWLPKAVADLELIGARRIAPLPLVD
jgi:hypothetical protein